MCTWSASLANSAKSASVPFQPNGLTTRSPSTPRMPEASISPFAGARRFAREVGALPLQIATHLSRQRLDDAERHQRRRVPLVAAPCPLSVALAERVVGLGSRSVRAAAPVARGTRHGLRTPEEPAVHP